MVLSFNASMFGGFPITGFSLHWYGKLLRERAGAGRVPDIAVDRTGHGARDDGRRHRGRAWRWSASSFRESAVNTLAILPALVPETILGVGLLVLIKAIDQPRTYLLLLLGHILLAVPFVVLVDPGATDRHPARL